MSHRFLVLGGGVGLGAVACILERFPEDKVVIGDSMLDRIRPGVERLNDFYKPMLPCELMQFNAEDLNRAFWHFANFDVIISALPARYNYALAETAIEAGAHFCDLGGVLEVTKEMRQLDQRAKQVNISVVPDCGLMPGAGVILAKYLCESFTKLRDGVIFVGGLPQRPEPPLHYQQVFSLEGLKHLCYDEAEVVEHGQVINKPSLSELETLHPKELAQWSKPFGGAVEAFITAGLSLASTYFRDRGFGNFSERTVRWPGFVDFVRDIPSDTFERMIAPHVAIPVDQHHPDLVWMRVEVSGSSSPGIHEKRTLTLLDLFEETNGLSAMTRTTGYFAALSAKLIAKGMSEKGVATPELAFGKEATDWFVKKSMEWFDLKKGYELLQT